jgi:hypothetical protein
MAKRRTVHSRVLWGVWYGGAMMSEGLSMVAACREASCRALLVLHFTLASFPWTMFSSASRASPASLSVPKGAYELLSGFSHLQWPSGGIQY